MIESAILHYFVPSHSEKNLVYCFKLFKRSGEDAFLELQGVVS
jgi:hypothetical protein